MYDDQTWHSGREVHNPPGLASSSPVVTEPLLFAKIAQPTLQVSHSALIAVPFSLLAIWTIALIYFNQLTKRHNGLSPHASRKPNQRVPCRPCIFFKNSPYLKCAIRPLDALTANAIDCADYAAQADRQQQ